MAAELESMRAALEAMNAQVTQLAAALHTEREERKRIENKSNPSIIDAIRKGHMKDIAPRKFSDIQKSGSFKLWAKELKDYVYWHDKTIREAIEYFEEKWTIDDELTYNDAKQCMTDKGLEMDVDAALHMIISAFTEGEARVLAENAEFTNPDTLTTHKSGLELWRLLKYQFDRTTSFNVITVLEVIRAMPAAKTMQEVLPKLAGLEKAHQEYHKIAVASKDLEFERMRKHGVSLYPEFFKKADLLNIVPDVILKELKKARTSTSRPTPTRSCGTW